VRCFNPSGHHVTYRDERCVPRRPTLCEVVGEFLAPRHRLEAGAVERERSLDGLSGRGVLADNDTDLEDAGSPFAQRTSAPVADGAESRAIFRVIS
jgi:hypothetical protein